MERLPEDELKQLIDMLEEQAVATFPRERRLGLMEVSRAMDFYWTRGRFGPSERVATLEETLPEFGLNRALELLLDQSSRGPRFPLMPSTKEKEEWADSVLFLFGAMGRCEALLEMSRLGLGAIEKDGPKSYRFTYTKNPIGLEALEKSDVDWYQQEVRRQQGPELRELGHQSQKVWSVMDRLVGTSHDHYIQYDADPEVDEYYYEQGILQSQGFFGQDSFPDDASFGGAHFSLFTRIAGLLIGLALKHLDFCLLLLRRAPELNPRNILTIPQDWDVMSSTLALASGEDQGAVESVLSVLTLSLDNKRGHCSVPGNFVAPALIKCGDGRVIKPIWGCLSHPFQSMLQGLRMQYSRDWDREVERREGLFRQELYELFPGPRFARIETNIRLRKEGVLLTDIDALVLDREEGVLALFQLKWQDSFRHSLRSRESKKVNFQKAANQWVARVSDWLAGQGIRDAAVTLGFASHDARLVRKILLFVVGRNAAHFSGEGNLDHRAAWGTWFKILRITIEELNGNMSLLGLYEKMVSLSPLRQELRAAEAKVRVGDVVITLEGFTRIPAERHGFE